MRRFVLLLSLTICLLATNSALAIYCGVDHVVGRWFYYYDLVSQREVEPMSGIAGQGAFPAQQIVGRFWATEHMEVIGQAFFTPDLDMYVGQSEFTAAKLVSQAEIVPELGIVGRGFYEPDIVGQSEITGLDSIVSREPSCTDD